MIGINDFVQKVKKFFSENGEEGDGGERVTYVRIQKCEPVSIGFGVGGEMKAMLWEDVRVEEHEAGSGKALMRSKFSVTHPQYATQYVTTPSLEFDDPLQRVPDSVWVRTYPQDPQPP